MPVVIGQRLLLGNDNLGADGLVDQFGIQGAPTLIVIKDGATAKYDNASAIMGFAKAM